MRICCDAEVLNRKAMRSLPKGRLAWKGCCKTATAVRVGAAGVILNYCAKHANAKGHGGDRRPI